MSVRKLTRKSASWFIGYNCPVIAGMVKVVHSTFYNVRK